MWNSLSDMPLRFLECSFPAAWANGENANTKVFRNLDMLILLCPLHIHSRGKRSNVRVDIALLSKTLFVRQPFPRVIEIK